MDKIDLLRFNSIIGHTLIDGFNKDSVVIDLGANKGNFSKEIIKKYKFSKLILVEPHPGLAKELKDIFKDNDSVKIIEAAIGDKTDDSIEFYLSKNREAGSVNKNIIECEGADDVCAKINVRTITLKDIIERFDIKKIDLLKIDIDGSEYDLFHSLTGEASGIINQISVKFHDNIGVSSKEATKECVHKLKRLGYSYYNPSKDNNYMDCLFYKPTLGLILHSYFKLFVNGSRSLGRKIVKHAKFHQISQAFSAQTLNARGYNYSQQRRLLSADKMPIFSADRTEAPSSLNPLKSYFDSHRDGKGIWKWSHYFDIYHRHFKEFVGKDVHILEIGVYSGGSLEMWREYFGPNCHVYGVDINEACKVYKNEYTTIFIGDQADRKFWKLVKEKVPRVDILIDDGGHEAEQQMITLEEMLPHISPGGIYLCEDLQGRRNKFIHFVYGLSSALYDFLGSQESDSTYNAITTPFQKHIGSVHCYPYVVVIEKVVKPEEKFIAPKRGSEWQPL